jgi:hypothetical protein
LRFQLGLKRFEASIAFNGASACWVSSSGLAVTAIALASQTGIYWRETNMKFKGFSLKGALSALAIGAALLLGGSEMTYSQDHHQRHERRELREHQGRERYHYGNSIKGGSAG